MKKKKKIKASALRKKLERQKAKEAGFYDGRFRKRVIKDKKKDASRKEARKFRMKKLPE